MANDRRHLNLVHGEDHGARPAAPAQLKAPGRDRLQPQAPAAELGWNQGGQRPLGSQCLERLGRETRLAVDIVGIPRRDLLGDLADGVDERLRAIDRHGHDSVASERSALTAFSIDAMLSNTLAVSIWSGNSMSK